MEKVVGKLNKFIGHHIIEIQCDSNSIISHCYLEGAEIVHYTNGSGNKRKAIYFKTKPIPIGSKTLEKGEDGIEYEMICPKCNGSGNDQEIGYVFGFGYILCSQCDGRGTILK
jgi:DnaJ-class molecular chaperone